MFDEEKSCWMKIWFRANFSSNIFRLIRQNFHVVLTYPLFHQTFHSYDVISNLRTSNFEWFNKTKTLCKIITIKKIMHIKFKWAWTATKKILTIYLNYKNKMEKNTKMEQKRLKIVEQEKASRPKKVYKKNRKKEKLRKLIRSRVLPRRCFSSSEFTSSDKDETYWVTRTNDINFHPKFFQRLPKISSNMLDKMLDRFN